MIKRVKRHPDWQNRLAALLTDKDKDPHEWSTWDCAVGLACGVVVAVRGDDYDFSQDYAGTYDSYETALIRISEVDGVDSVRALVRKKLGPSCHIASARQGDLVMFGPALGVMYAGSGYFIGCEEIHGVQAKAGLIRLPISDLSKRAFRV